MISFPSRKLFLGIVSIDQLVVPSPRCVARLGVSLVRGTQVDECGVTTELETANLKVVPQPRLPAPPSGR